MQIRPSSSLGNPGVSASLSAPRPQEALPLDSALLYEPRPEGGYRPVLKVPVQGGPSYGVEVAPGVHRAITADGAALQVLDAHGNKVFSFVAPDRVCSAEYQAREDRWFVRSERALHALDGATGAELARLEPEGMNSMAEMGLLSTGDLVLTLPGSWSAGAGQPARPARVLGLRADLSSRWERDLHFRGERPVKILDLGGGHTAVYDEGMALLALDQEGQQRLEAYDLHSLSPQVDGGELVFLRGGPRHSAERHAEVVRFDPVQGKSRSIRVDGETQRVYPLADGAFLTRDDHRGQVRLRVYDRTGECRRESRLPEGTLWELQVSGDGRTALALIGNRDFSLYRLDLGERKGFLSRLLPGGERPVRLHASLDRFQAVLLEDGRVALLERRRIGILGPDGKVEPQARLEDLLALPVDGRILPTVPIGVPPEMPCPARWDAMLNRAEALCGTSFRAPAPEVGCSVDPAGALSFALPVVPDLPWVVGRAAQTAQDLFRSSVAIVQDRRWETSVPFPGDPGWKLNMRKDRLEVVDPAGNATRFSPIQPYKSFTVARPLVLEGRHLVVAATSGGRVQWMEAGKEAAVRSVDLGQPVQDLLVRQGRVLATTESGAVLSLEVPGLGGEERPSGGAHSAQVSSPGGVEISGRTVRIGGITLARRER